MEKKKKNNVGKIIPLCLLLALLGTGLYLYNNHNTDITDEIIITNNGINLKLLSQGVNAQGETTYTFSYVITPENATDHSVSLSLSYKDDNIELTNNEISYEIDESIKQITLTCHSDFDRIILFKITSNQNPSAYAEVDLHYEKKLLSIDYKDDYYYFGGSSSHNNLSDFKASSFIKPTYSLYTKDKEYTFSPKSFDIIEENRSFSVSHNLTPNFFKKLSALIVDKFLTQGTSITSQEMWALDESNSIRSSLEKISSENYEDNYVSYVVQTAEYYCNEKPEITINDPQRLSLMMYFDFDYSNFIINTDSIIVDFTEIIF